MIFSVVIPLYNKESSIQQTIQSVLRQTVESFELIIIDDGSTDSSAKIVQSIKDNRIRLIQQENRGKSETRNRGIKESGSDLIAFLDADDEWTPNFLETILRMVEKYPDCGAYATAFEVIEPNRRRWRPFFRDIPQPPWEGIIPNYFQSVLGEALVWTSAVTIPKHVFDSVGGFPPGVKQGQDMDMWCRVALQYRVAFSTHTGAIYHRDAENRTVVDPDQRVKCLLGTLEQALQSEQFLPEISAEDLREYRSKLLIDSAVLFFLSGNKTEGRRYLRAASPSKEFSQTLRWWHLLSLAPTQLLLIARMIKEKTRLLHHPVK